MPVRVEPDVAAAMERHARSAPAEEVVGAVLGRVSARGEVVAVAFRPLANRAPDRRRSFELDPWQLCAIDGDARDAGLRLLGIFHSHPSGIPEPSARDRAAVWPGRFAWIGVVGADDRFGLAGFVLQCGRPPAPAGADQNRNV